MAGTRKEGRAGLASAFGLGLLALAWRLALVGRYWGHEEEDWGNLLLIRGVLDSRFTTIETEHMPLFSWLAAAATAVVGDPRTGGLLVSISLGALAVALCTWIGWRWLSPAAGLAAGLLLCFQPEAALYSASVLRESTYMAAMLAGVALVGVGRGGAGGGVLSLAFLARFNPAFSLLPALGLLIARDRRDRRAWRAAAILGGTVLAWAIYYRLTVGHWSFWGGVLERNTGEAVSDLSPRERGAAVWLAFSGLFGRVLPAHAGHLVCLLAIPGALLLGRGARPDAARWLGFAGLGTVGLLAATAVVSAYDPAHNLYWKWLTPSVPFLVLFAAHGAVELGRSPRLGRTGALVLVALLVQSGFAYTAQTAWQVDRSQRWYGTQIELMRWVERAYPPGVAVITDAIPAWYLLARRSPVTPIRWSDPAVPRNDPDAFGEFLAREHVVLVQWFAEDWVGAREAAPWLEHGKAVAVGDAFLLPVAREDGYGFIAYAVSGPLGIPQPSEPLPGAAGSDVGADDSVP